ncbi:MAG: MotA/TolQ/ExbB proton channel family protein [Verrucomicrobiota bacterium]|nr:MotA/TolQ/ExbB proton channel family protein [Verrucomicrobiota bacterium]MEC8753428.1 MotA/TolQ/ExbB proton channel family protein [Verrucomicrobiota bacterium]
MKNVIILLLFVLASLFKSEAQTIDMQEKLNQSLSDLSQIRKSIADEKLPMVKELNLIEDDLLDVRLEYQEAIRKLDNRSLDLNNLRSEIKTRRDEKNYISNLLGEYIRNFQTRLHISEINKYNDIVNESTLAPENSNLSDTQIFSKQIALVESSVDRLTSLVGGVSFNGTAIGKDGLVKNGKFILLGPVALFSSDDDSLVGIAEQQLGSLEPTVMPFMDVKNVENIKKTVNAEEGLFPFDPSLGNARKIEETSESLFETINKGGIVGYVIVLMFFAVLSLSIFKWIQLSKIPMPRETDFKPLLNAMLYNDFEKAKSFLKTVKGPTANMLNIGLEHINEDNALVEEVMYEEMLTTRLKVEKYTPFIAVCASSAPLLGLLGTVTGIINTFKLITVFGSGDVKTLSGGISEALITTALGLIVAIFSLILFAFLSRKAKTIMDRMEKIAILFMNRTIRTAPEYTK